MDQQIALPVSVDVARSRNLLSSTLASEQGVVDIAIFDDRTALRDVKSALQTVDIKLFGRVSTHKGTATRETCSVLINDWFKEHPDLDGIFVGEGPPLDTEAPEEYEPEWVWNYYGSDKGFGIYNTIKREHHGAMVCLNCPSCRDPAVFGACDIAEVVEQDYAHYSVKAWWTGASEPWWSDPPAGKAIAHVVHSCPDVWSMRVAVALSKLRKARYVYVFAGGSEVPTDPPPYWDAETAIVASTPTEPCQIIADVLPDMAQAIDNLTAQLYAANSDERALLIQELARLEMRRAEVTVILNECVESQANS